MKKSRPTLLGLVLAAVGIAAAQSPAPVAPKPVIETGHYRNLFGELLGKTDVEVDAKIDSYWKSFFYGNPDTQCLFYPIHDEMAYIPDVGNNDVRSEGMSYGMMLCVQLDHQKEFNMLWKYAKTYMYNAAGPQKGFFNWHTRYDGGSMGQGAAPDGEQWFTIALFFAAHRWGNGEGIYNYEAQAQEILTAMLHHDEFTEPGTAGNMFEPTAKMVRFTPGSTGTDASYHLPAFYELWSRWAKEPRDQAFMADAAKVSRQFFVDVADPTTGLMPNQSPIPGAGGRGGRRGGAPGAGGIGAGATRGGASTVPTIEDLTAQLMLTPEQVTGITPILAELTKKQAALAAAQAKMANPRATLISQISAVLPDAKKAQLARYNAAQLAEYVRGSNPSGGPGGNGGFAEDAWRTLAYPALDWSWWGADPREVAESNRVLTFLALQPEDNWPYHFDLNGNPTVANDDSPGMHAMAAVAGLAADPAVAKPFVQHLWDMPIPDDSDPKRDHVGGRSRKQDQLRSHRYYDGLLSFLGLLEVSGHFRIYAPPTAVAAH